jgi:hypothetical protein
MFLTADLFFKLGILVASFQNFYLLWDSKLCNCDHLGGMGDFEDTVDYVSDYDGCPFDIGWLDCAWDMLDWLETFI